MHGIPVCGDVFNIKFLSLQSGLSEAEAGELCEWFQTVLGDKVAAVKTTRRLQDNPAIVSSHESGSLRRMMRMVEQQVRVLCCFSRASVLPRLMPLP